MSRKLHSTCSSHLNANEFIVTLASIIFLASGCAHTRNEQTEVSGGIQTTPRIEESGMSQMTDSTKSSTAPWQEIDTITIEGQLLKKGDPIEKVQRLLPREQQIRDENVKRTDDGLILTRHYYYRNQYLDIVLKIERGKYRVVGIRVKSK